MSDIQVGDRVRPIEVTDGSYGIVVSISWSLPKRDGKSILAVQPVSPDLGPLMTDYESRFVLVESAHYAAPGVSMVAIDGTDALKLRALLTYAYGHPDFYLRGDLEQYVHGLIARARGEA